MEARGWGGGGGLDRLGVLGLGLEFPGIWMNVWLPKGNAVFRRKAGRR